MSVRKLAPAVFLFVLATCFPLTSSFAYGTKTQVGYTVAPNNFQGSSETWRGALDFDQFNCGYYVWDDIYGSYCYMWLLSENNPSVDAYVRLPSSATEWKGFVEDGSHATVSYNFSPSIFGRWAGTANHYVQQHGYVMYCPYNFCTGWIPVAYNQYYLGHTEAEHTIISFDVVRHSSAVLSDAEVDSSTLPNATTRLQANDGQGDVACAVSFRKNGSISIFYVTDGIVSDQSEQDAVIQAGGRVKVVREILWCNGPVGQVTTGCSGSAGMILESSAQPQGLLWAHEYGHNQSLWFGPGGHNPNPEFVGYATLAPDGRKVTQSECTAFRIPL